METNTYILTLSCPDTIGIVAEVSSFLAENQGFILDSNQFGDAVSKKFFVRVVFTSPVAIEHLSTNFTKVAKHLKLTWDLYNTEDKTKTLILVSKQGHCLNGLLHRWKTGRLNIDIAAIASNHKDLEEMAKWYKIPFHHLPITPETKPEQEKEILKLVETLDIDLVLLARYMQILSSTLTEKLYGKAINIHHSFLPSFIGAKPYHQAFQRGVKLIGATAHYVTDNLDEGPIIEQQVTRVDHTYQPKELTAQGCDIEDRVLAKAVQYYTERRILLDGNKTVIFT